MELPRLDQELTFPKLFRFVKVIPKGKTESSKATTVVPHANVNILRICHHSFQCIRETISLNFHLRVPQLKLSRIGCCTGRSNEEN